MSLLGWGYFRIPEQKLEDVVEIKDFSGYSVQCIAIVHEFTCLAQRSRHRCRSRLCAVVMSSQKWIVEYFRWIDRWCMLAYTLCSCSVIIYCFYIFKFTHMWCVCVFA